MQPFPEVVFKMLTNEKGNLGAQYTIKMGLNLDMIQSSLDVRLVESDGEERDRKKQE